MHFLAVWVQLANVVEVPDVDASVTPARESYWRHQAARLRNTVAVPAVQTTLLTRSHDTDDLTRLLLQINIGTVTLV